MRRSSCSVRLENVCFSAIEEKKLHIPVDKCPYLYYNAIIPKKFGYNRIKEDRGALREEYSMQAGSGQLPKLWRKGTGAEAGTVACV